MRRARLQSPQTASANPIVNYHVATPDYFKAMRIPLRARPDVHRRRWRNGRRASRSISESTAAAFFPGQDPIGKRIKAASFNANQRAVEGVWRTVVGVVGNVRYKGLHEVPLRWYDPPAQTTVGTTTSLVVRLKTGQEGQALAVAAAIQTQARQRDARRARQRHHDARGRGEQGSGAVAIQRVGVRAVCGLGLRVVDAWAVQPGHAGRRQPAAGVCDSDRGGRHPWAHRRRSVPFGRRTRGHRHRDRPGGRRRRDAQPAGIAVASRSRIA